MVDPDGRSPIFDKYGYLLGCDDEGLQGMPVIMNDEDFSQGMSHVEAVSVNKGADYITKKSDYFLFAQARGESFWGIIKNHGIRNILLPAITIQFMSFNELFGGTILVEQVFAYPGIGQATVAAGLRSDVPLLLGVVIVSTIFVFVGNLIADMIYEYVITEDCSVP